MGTGHPPRLVPWFRLHYDGIAHSLMPFVPTKLNVAKSFFVDVATKENELVLFW
jgi:hypothetical protein